ncbi:hypothetical protein L1987_67608 [Smallanthus sonchifolius]|uniref:Uncharacterized protein n=1 Tax=Smallanthus sonchifolius TaxID=185202 RepID=A0ACB9B2N5_9ASTR|nr:hypothetical protein L1987_67608 [Smallanthus sonchifolius]
MNMMKSLDDIFLGVMRVSKYKSKEDIVCHCHNIRSNDGRKLLCRNNLLHQKKKHPRVARKAVKNEAAPKETSFDLANEFVTLKPSKSLYDVVIANCSELIGYGSGKRDGCLIDCCTVGPVGPAMFDCWSLLYECSVD